MKKSLMISLVILYTLAFAGAASAHVTVQPQQVPANSYQVFTLRVPSEKEAATTQVKVDVPAGVEVSRFEPKPDWTYDLEKNADGKIVSVTWKTAGNGLSATEFGQFNFQGKVAADAKELVWNAHQTYSDGSVVDWTGAAGTDSKTPASVTQVTAATGEGDGHHGAAAGTTNANENDTEVTWTLALSAAALVVALIALFVGIRKKA